MVSTVGSIKALEVHTICVNLEQIYCFPDWIGPPSFPSLQPGFSCPWAYGEVVNSFQIDACNASPSYLLTGFCEASLFRSAVADDVEIQLIVYLLLILTRSNQPGYVRWVN